MKSLARLATGSLNRDIAARTELSRTLRHTGDFEFLGAPFRVHASSQGPLAYLERIYRYFRRDAQDDRLPGRMWVVEQDSPAADVLAGLLASPRPIPGHAVVVDSFDYAVVVANRTMLRYYLSKLLRLAVVAISERTHVTLHAASVCGGGCGLLLIGEAAVGKTSLSLALIERGFRYGADDTTPVRRNHGTCDPFPTPFIVRGAQDTGAPLLPELEGRRPDIALLNEPRWLVDRWKAVAEPFRPDFLIFLDGQAGAGVAPISPANAAIELLRNVIFPLGADLTRIPLHERYLDDALILAGHAQALRVGSRRPGDALHAILDLVGAGTAESVPGSVPDEKVPPRMTTTESA
ncbi:MAG: hypothetical protein MJE77_41010 [Proteobacteria bacterium]|nr:hypothetical protein [Pseudomonadota bacterium]